MLEHLDITQNAFCASEPGNLRLLAPAGCGKTLCLLFRCKHLAEQAHSHRPRFLIVTFTVAAKQELLTRVNEDGRFAALRDALEITTLNSWGFRRIKNIASSPKLIKSKADFHFAVLNQIQPIWKSHDRVRSAIEKAQNVAPRKLMDLMDAFKSIGYDHLRHGTYEDFAAHANALRTHGLAWKLDEYADKLAKLGVLECTIRKEKEVVRSGDRTVYNAFFRFWREATAHLIANATFTLEDQKYYAYLDEKQKLMEGKFLQGAARYDHVLIDEFQDINPLDLNLIKAVVMRNRATVTIIGDDDQAIFEWRGATPEYILDPAKYFEVPFDTHTLKVNYRSPSNIVDHAQRLIAHNKRRVSKDIRAHRSDDAVIDVVKTADISEALNLVYSIVEDCIGQGQSPCRVAVIGRKRSQIIPYQVYFASKKISFCAAEDLQVFMSAAFDRLLRLLMMKCRATVRLSRTEVVNDLLELCNLVKRYPLNKGDRESLRRYLQQTGASTLIAAVDALATYTGTLKGRNPDGRVSRAMAEAVRAFLDATTVTDALIKLSERFEGLHVDLGKAEDDIFYTDPPFFQLAEFALQYGDDYGRFVDDIELAKDQLAYIPPFEDEQAAGSNDELWRRPLHLMTALRAKGKEFHSVVLLDVNDGIWPSRHAKTPQQLEAERRVFYVAFTRARARVLMLVSSHLGNRNAVVSPYLEELGLEAADHVLRSSDTMVYTP